jgi:hypothetical protein
MSPQQLKDVKDIQDILTRRSPALILDVVLAFTRSSIRSSTQPDILHSAVHFLEKAKTLIKHSNI